VRIPSHPLFRELIERSGCPLAAPSANTFGYVSPTTAEHVRDGLGRSIAYILEGGAAAIGVESTILDLRDPRQPAILRPGAVSREELERVLGRKVSAYKRKAVAATAAPAPGMLERHYSPRTPLILVRKLSKTALRNLPADEALLLIHQPQPAPSAPNVFWLANREADLAQAAHNLFEQLRSLDKGGWTQIRAERAGGKSALALAINDRLSRASAKRDAT
jgi:L-threonylcarbamoyladenylate synthase